MKIQTGEPKNGQLPGTASLVCFGIYRRTPVTREFSYEEIKTLFYDLAHLDGRITALTRADFILKISSQDRAFLQEFLSKNYLRSAIPPPKARRSASS